MRSASSVAQAPATESRVTASFDQPWHLWVGGVIYLACTTAFIGDLTTDVSWAYGVLYIPVVCTAVFYRDPNMVWWLAAIAIAMAVLGCLFPEIDFSPSALINRGLSIAAILTAAALVRIARGMRDLLEQQTHRAQAADRLKSQILANLSHELRTPLNPIMGFSELLLADCRQDQRNSLEHLHSAGRRLLVTIENLLDLTHSTDRVLRAEQLDVAAILHQAIAAARNGTAERNITLVSNIAANTPQVLGDAWATRRIADNLIGNALKFTAPGGSVRVATETTDDSVVAVVEDTGGGMSSETLDHLGEPFFQADAGADRPFEGLGTGLALCRKLADAMGAKLEFASRPGQGTTVRLSLRAA